MDERVSTLIRQGQQAMQRGNPGMAREYLRAAVDLEPDNATALLWLAGVLEEPAEQRNTLERVLVLEPDNARARQGLDELYRRYGESLAAVEEEEELWGDVALPTTRPGTGPLSIEEEIRAALRVNQDSINMADDMAMPEPESNTVRSFFRSGTSDMPYRVAVAALVLTLLLGALCMVLLLLQVGPFVPRV